MSLLSRRPGSIVPGTFTVTASGNGAHICVIGPLVRENVDELKRIIDFVLSNGGRPFVIDLTHSAYIDASGLGRLVSLNKTIRLSGGTLTLSGVSDDLQTLLTLTGLVKLFTIVANGRAV